MSNLTAHPYYNNLPSLSQPPVELATTADFVGLLPGTHVDASSLFGDAPDALTSQRLAARHYADVLASALPSVQELDGGSPWSTPAGRSIEAMSKCGARRIAARVKAPSAADGAQYAHISGRYCKGPVCPICAARRAHNSTAKYLAALSWLQGERLAAHQKPLQAVYIVLSFRNQSPRAVPAARLVLAKALEYFCDVTKNKRFAVLVKDSIRTVESTLNTDVSKTGALSPWFGTLNIHANLLCLVSASYFTSRDYVKQEELVDDWRDCVVRACQYWQTHTPDIASVWVDMLYKHTPDYDTAPNGCFESFDPARYLGPNGEIDVHIERVKDKKTRKSMDISAGIIETVKYCLKSDDLEKMSKSLQAAGYTSIAADDLERQVLLGYCCLFYDLRRCTCRGLWRKAFKALKMAADSEDVGVEMLELDPDKAHIFGLGFAQQADACGYVLLQQYFGADAVAALSAYVSGNLRAMSAAAAAAGRSLAGQAAALDVPSSDLSNMSVDDLRKAYAAHHPHRTGRKTSLRTEISKGLPGPADDPMVDAVELPPRPDDVDLFPGVQLSFSDD